MTIDRGMRALSIRQPYAEWILREIKPIEFRWRATRIIGGHRGAVLYLCQQAVGGGVGAGCLPRVGPTTAGCNAVAALACAIADPISLQQFDTFAHLPYCAASENETTSADRKQ